MSNAPHRRSLERMYRSAPTNRYYRPEIEIGDATAVIRIPVREDLFHVAEAVLVDSEGREIGRGSGTFMRSRLSLAPELGYA